MRLNRRSPHASGAEKNDSRARPDKNSSIQQISRHASPPGGFLFHAGNGHHSLNSLASDMVNHDAPHQLRGAAAVG